MAEMDLNIDNYSVTDLENFFKLKKGRYTYADIERREYEIREQLLSSGHINKKFKRDLIAFLIEAKENLSYTVEKDPLPTTISKNAILDTSNVPKSAELATSRAPLIIERPPTNYINVQQSEYYQGIINPLQTRIIHKNITVDTRFRDRYYQTVSSNFMISLPMRLNKVVSMQMTALELPKNFYNISSDYRNNYFIMHIFHSVNGELCEDIKTIVVPNGNYTADGLIKQLNRVVCPGGIPCSDDIFTNVKFSLTTNGELGDGYDAGKVIISADTEEIGEIVLNFETDPKGDNDIIHLSQKLGWILGFLNAKYRGSSMYMGEKPVETNSIRYIYLAVDDFNKSVNETFITAFAKNEIKPNILARITNVDRSNENTIINKEYAIVSEPRKYFGPVDIQKLHVQLFDDYGRIINTNFCDYSFCLHLQLVYDL